jgi:hypothetical protein
MVIVDMKTKDVLSIMNQTIAMEVMSNCRCLLFLFLQQEIHWPVKVKARSGDLLFRHQKSGSDGICAGV